MKKLLFFAAVLAATLASCQKEKTNTAQSVQGDNGSAVGFSTYNQKTKGEVAYYEDLTDNGFIVYGFLNETDSLGNPTTWNSTLFANFFADESGITGGKSNNPQFVEYNGAWVYDPVQYWPDDDLASLDFIAYSPTKQSKGQWTYQNASSKFNPSSLGDFLVEPGIREQQDLLLATKFNAVQVSKVLLEFKHALSRIGFTAYTPGTEEIRVTKIQLQHSNTEDPDNPVGYFHAQGCIQFWVENALSGGDTYKMKWATPLKPLRPEFEWGDNEEKMHFTLTTDDFVNGGLITQTTPPERLNNEDKYIMFIPSTDGDKLQIYIEYDVINSGSGSTSHKSKAFTCPISKFEMGKAYTFNFNLALNEVAFDCVVIPWDESAASLNSGGNVTAKSSLEGYNVFVDAVRSSKQRTVSTAYTLYAEHKVSDETGEYMRPVWKTYNKWDSETTGFDVGIGELIDIYFHLYDYVIDDSYSGNENVTINEVTIEGTKYTCLNFTIDESDTKMKSALEGIYVAQYETDPIRAASYDGVGELTDVTVETKRAYTYWDYPSVSEDTPPEPYLTEVRLVLNDGRSSKTVNFNHWEKYNKNTAEWERIDYTTGEYSIDADNTLMFEEKMYEDGGATPVTPVSKAVSAKVLVSGKIISHQGDYRAVYGEGTGEIYIHVLPNGRDITIDPNQYSFESGTKVMVKAPVANKTETFEWWFTLPKAGYDEGTRIDADRYSKFQINGVDFYWDQNTTTGYETLTFPAAQEINGITFTAHYGSADVKLAAVSTDTNKVNYTKEVNNMELTTTYTITDLSDDFYSVEVADENGSWLKINDKELIDYNLFRDIKYDKSSNTIVFTVFQDKKTVQAALGKKMENISLRVNDSKTFTVHIDDGRGIQDYYYCYDNDRTMIHVLGSDLKIATDKKANNCCIFPGPSFAEDFYGFMRGGLTVKDSINIKISYPATTVTISTVYGNVYKFSNTTTNTGYTVWQQDLENFGTIKETMVLPTGVKIFLRKPSKETVEDVYVNGVKVTDEFQEDYGYPLNGGGATAPFNVEIKPVNGTEKLNPGGNLFD